MVASALNLGYDSGDGQDRYEYNGYSFGLTGQSWVTYLENGQSLRVLYGPRDLASFPVDSNIGPLQSTSKIYLSIDPREDVRMALAEFHKSNYCFLTLATISARMHAEHKTPPNGRSGRLADLGIFLSSKGKARGTAFKRTPQCPHSAKSGLRLR